METLYDKLQTAETVNLDLSVAAVHLYSTVLRFRDAPDMGRVTAVLPKETLPAISVPDYQRKIIKSYDTHPMVSAALKGVKSIEAKVDELISVNDGFFKIVLPKRENAGHNAEVDKLGELISPTWCLKTKGFFSPIVPANMAAYLSFFVGSGGAVAGYTTGQSGTAAVIGSAIGVAYSVLFVICFSGLSQYVAFKDVARDLKRQANYVDSKIKELF